MYWGTPMFGNATALEGWIYRENTGTEACGVVIGTEILRLDLGELPRVVLCS